MQRRYFVRQEEIKIEALDLAQLVVGRSWCQGA
jgi:hypothetical protein